MNHYSITDTGPLINLDVEEATFAPTSFFSYDFQLVIINKNGQRQA